MKINLLLTLTAFSLSYFGNGQTYTAYFDGGDTTLQSLDLTFDTLPNNTWQIGQPQKPIFNQAFSDFGVLITDTINSYPTNNTSRFYLNQLPHIQWGILAVQWVQKLDMADGNDYGYIEYSIDSGANWINVFDSPYTYNFYGFNTSNRHTLTNGDIVFSGIDTNWRDIWLCFDNSWLTSVDQFSLRYKFVSDSIETNQEGWMIDNFTVHETWFHTVKEIQQEDYISTFPNPANDRININVKKVNEFHIIEEINVRDGHGKLMSHFENVPTQFFMDVSHYKNGVYFIEVKTNLDRSMTQIVIQH